MGTGPAFIEKDQNGFVVFSYGILFVQPLGLLHYRVLCANSIICPRGEQQVVKEVGQKAAEEMAATLRLDELVLTDKQLQQVKAEGVWWLALIGYSFWRLLFTMAL